MWSEFAIPTPLVVAHRGASAYEPENTLRAIRRAFALGAPAVEVDVRRTREGALAILHDETVDRTTDGSGSVADMTLEEIRRLDAGKGERVPTLDEVLGAVKGDATLVIEIKERGLWPGVMRCLRAHPGRGNVFVVSFHRSEIADLKAAHRDIRCGALFVGPSADALAWTAEARTQLAGFRHEAVSKEVADSLHQAGRGLFVWTVNDAERAREVAAVGADFIVTDLPDVVLKAIEPG